MLYYYSRRFRFWFWECKNLYAAYYVTEAAGNIHPTDYYAFAHYSKYIKQGAQIVKSEVEGNPLDITCNVAKNPDNSENGGKRGQALFFKEILKNECTKNEKNVYCVGTNFLTLTL